MKKSYITYNKNLPVLDSIVEAFPLKEMPSFDSIAFVCVQHLLFTTVNLIESLIKLGACPDNIHIMGKSYSSCSQVIDKLVTNGCRCYSNSPQEKLGDFRKCFIQDIERMWQIVYDDLQHKKIKLLVILDDGEGVSAILKKYSLVEPNVIWFNRYPYA
jgi:S-adenosylhomocysteine hydrolase